MSIMLNTMILLGGVLALVFIVAIVVGIVIASRKK